MPPSKPYWEDRPDLARHDLVLSPDPISFGPNSRYSLPAEDNVVTISNQGSGPVGLYYLALEDDPTQFANPPYVHPLDVLRFADPKKFDPSAGDACLPWLSSPPSPGSPGNLITSRILDPGETCTVGLERFVGDEHYSRGWLVAYGANGNELGRALIEVYAFTDLEDEWQGNPLSTSQEK
jgi:hypothetical protein